ncbi:MAG: hypothetical protein U9Q78_04210 [Chloroflexota bacterium]|nr:hypothetical protein [Chloroflexota bacterium]
MNFLEILSAVKEVGLPVLLILVLIWLGFQLERIGSELNDLHQEIGGVGNDLREEIGEANKTLNKLLGVTETLVKTIP